MEAGWAALCGRTACCAGVDTGHGRPGSAGQHWRSPCWCWGNVASSWGSRCTCPPTAQPLPLQPPLPPPPRRHPLRLPVRVRGGHLHAAVPAGQRVQPRAGAGDHRVPTRLLNRSVGCLSGQLHGRRLSIPTGSPQVAGCSCTTRTVHARRSAHLHLNRPWRRGPPLPHLVPGFTVSFTFNARWFVPAAFLALFTAAMAALLLLPERHTPEVSRGRLGGAWRRRHYCHHRLLAASTAPAY